MPPNSSVEFNLPEFPWNDTVESVAQHLKVDPERGLKNSQAHRRRKDFGSNRIRIARPTGAWTVLANQFKSFIIMVLGAASLLAFSFGRTLEGTSIAAALFINTLIGFFMELRALRSMESLRKLARQTATILREGKVRKTDAAEIVPGDVVLLEAGDIVPADLRLTEANRLRLDQSSLTGESQPVTKQMDPVEKEAPLAERDCVAYRGTAVTDGSGTGIAVATGSDTRLGILARQISETSGGMTTLEKRLAGLGRRLIWATLILSALLTALGIARDRNLLEVVETIIALFVAAIPEGLPIVATVALARGMWRMAAKNAIVRRLDAVETLGGVNILCTDKTGTLTRNRMELERVLLPRKNGEIQEEEFFPGGPGREGPSDEARAPESLAALLEAGVLCSNASLDPENEDSSTGDPLELALLRAGKTLGIQREKLLETFPETREEAFDPQIKMMATCHRMDQGFFWAIKGAPEAVLGVCGRIAADGGAEALEENVREKWENSADEMAEKGLRVLALARKQSEDPDEDPYHDLVFLGLAGLMDPAREGVGELIERIRNAGIRLIMVTGDHPGTAAAVARDTRLTGNGDVSVLEGSDLEGILEAPPKKKARVLASSIFARVDPEKKLDLVALHQEAGSIVAMTGDGVNDGPSLRKADVGIAMGKKGTEVAKEAADMVLTDDRLQSIFAGIHYGRVIFQNIRRFIIFLLSGNASQILVVGAGIAAGWPLPLKPLQILYLNIIGDVFPALALGVGKGDSEVMNHPPRPREESFLTGKQWLFMGVYSFFIAAPVLSVLALSLFVFGDSASRAVTLSFLTLAFARLWHVFNMRAPGSGLLKNDIVRNPYIWGALMVCCGFLAAAVAISPLSLVLQIDPPGMRGWSLILGFSLVPLFLGQATLILRGNLKKTPDQMNQNTT